jgi:dienelactone hydrolase
MMQHNPVRKMRVSRRRMLQALSLGSAGLALPDSFALHAMQTARAPETRTFAPLNRFPRMVQEFFVRRENEIQAQRLKTLAALATRSDAEAYVQTVRGKIRECVGPYPEKTPLNGRVTKVVERDAYKIEHVIFESRPGFLVSANLYIPKGRTFPLPGVVASCGHSDNGKAIDTYQSFTQGLARLGYVVLIFDPIGQGERMQYVDANLKPMRGTGTAEHNYAGIQQILVDERFWMWRAWDGIRALDYLMSRKEVDVRHLGITGNSGGGTMTTWLCGVEDRWTMAAPSCFVTEFRRNMENELGADMEQCPPRAIALGLDHEDFLAALAPKPIIILAKEKDYFDARGNEAAYHRLSVFTGCSAPKTTSRISSGPPTTATRKKTAKRCIGGSTAAPAFRTRRPSPRWYSKETKPFGQPSAGRWRSSNRKPSMRSRRTNHACWRPGGSISTAQLCRRP